MIKIAILMCTYNGEKFIRDQLDSIHNQTFKNWELHISDDNSSDNTVEVIQAYSTHSPNNIFLYKGPQKGFCQNFLFLSRINISAHYYAFCDQDDVWDPLKLEHAVAHLSQYQETTAPSVYCSRTTYVDRKLKVIGSSPLFSKAPSFENSLVQSIAGGNTMVFNQAAKKLIEQTVALDAVVSHDWWLYLLTTGAGGNFFYDKNSNIKYRQHSANIVGSNTSILSKLTRAKRGFDGKFKLYLESNTKALLANQKLLSQKNLATAKSFQELRKGNILQKIKIITKLKIRRQTFLGTIALTIALITNKA